MRHIQTISFALMSWFAYSRMARVHSVFALLLFAIGAANTAAIWLLRYDRRIAAKLANSLRMAPYLNLIATCSGTQKLSAEAPSNAVGNPPSPCITKANWRDTSQSVKRLVSGHDQAIDIVVTRIRNAAALRAKAANKGRSLPIAAFLLVGPEGIGKRYLTGAVASAVYGSSSVIGYDCGRATAATLFGTDTLPGQLVELVRTQPKRVILFENVEQASQDLITVWIRLLKSGTCASQHKSEFCKTIWFFSATSGAFLDGPSPLNHGESVRLLEQEARYDSAWLRLLTEIVPMHPPDNRTKAEVVCRLMTREAAEHGVELHRVDPLIVATQAHRIDEQLGFETLTHSIKRLMATPLLHTTQCNGKHLTLRIKPAVSRQEAPNEL